MEAQKLDRQRQIDLRISQEKERALLVAKLKKEKEDEAERVKQQKIKEAAVRPDSCPSSHFGLLFL